MYREGNPSFTRRQLIGAGAVAGLSAALPSRVFAQAMAPQPALDPALRERALAALDAQSRSIPYRDVIGIVDFAQASRDDRFFLVDLGNGFTTSYQVCHGRGSDPQHTGWLDHFSNAFGSEASSSGAYVTGDVYYGKYGRSLRLRGLDPSNSNAEGRAIVVHSAAYAEPRMISAFGKLGRSEGCFALSQTSLQYVLSKLGPGRLLYADKLAG